MHQFEHIVETKSCITFLCNIDTFITTCQVKRNSAKWKVWSVVVIQSFLHVMYIMHMSADAYILGNAIIDDSHTSLDQFMFEDL